MDYLHYRYKKFEPFEYLKMSEAKKKVARAYMKYEIDERIAEIRHFYQFFGGDE